MQPPECPGERSRWVSEAVAGAGDERGGQCEKGTLQQWEVSSVASATAATGRGAHNGEPRDDDSKKRAPRRSVGARDDDDN